MKACTAIVNEKGGVGKSCITINMAALLTRMTDYRVLVIDTDAQCNTTTTLLGDQEAKFTLFDVLNEDVTAKEAIIHTKYGDLLPGSTVLNSDSPQLYISKKQFAAYAMIKNIVDSVADDYDFVFIDTSTDSGFYTTSAIIACTGILIPVIGDRFSIDGVTAIKRRIDEVNQYYGKQVRIYGVIMNRIRLASRTNKDLIAQLPSLCESKGIYVFNSFIRDCQAITDCINNKKSIIDGDMKSNGFKDFSDLIIEWADVISK